MAMLLLALWLVWTSALAAPSPGELQDALAELAARAVPAVVVVKVDRHRPLAPELRDLLQELGLPRVADAPISGEATGSGVVVSPEGRVLTNAHVVDGATMVTLVLSDQRRLPARVLGSDARTDVAVLQIESGGPFSWLPLGDSAEVEVGDMVLAVGNPFEFQSTVTLGIISAKGRRGLGAREIQDYLQTDAAVNPGSSGGPLLDLEGRVIGINTAIFAPEVDQNSGISFAVPSNLVARVVEDLEAGEGVPRSWVGLVTRSVTTVDGDATLRGAEVLRVLPDSPAERSGLRRGDILVSVDGEPTPSSDALRTLVLARDVGSSLAVVARRDGRPLEIDVTTRDERLQWVGAQDLPRDAVYWAGMFLAAPSDELRARFGVGSERGLIVARVDADSDAARLGLEPGDLVVEVAGTPVTDPDGLRGLLASTERGVLVLGIRRSGSRTWAILPAP